MRFDADIAGKEAIEKHIKDIQEKYVSCATNIQNLKVLIREINKDMITPEEIKALDKLIKDGDESFVGERDKQKQMSVTLDQHNAQILSNESAMKMYKTNINFLRKQLGM